MIFSAKNKGEKYKWTVTRDKKPKIRRRSVVQSTDCPWSVDINIYSDFYTNNFLPTFYLCRQLGAEKEKASIDLEQKEDPHVHQPSGCMWLYQLVYGVFHLRENLLLFYGLDRCWWSWASWSLVWALRFYHANPKEKWHEVFPCC